MNKLQTLKGFRDFLPKDALKRTWVKNKMISVAERWGYEPIETPTLEPYSLFKGKIGEDEKLFYKFTDTISSASRRKYSRHALLDRLPAGEYHQHGDEAVQQNEQYRYAVDAEVIAENLDTYLAIGFKKPVVIFNNRDLMKDIPYSAIVAIDKLKKIGEQGVINNMVQKGINKSQASDYLKFVMDMKPDATVKTIISYLEKSGFGREYYRFEPTLARSFSYSQGPIWEIIIEDYETGSVGGGERYDGMMKRLTGLDIPATGIAFGFDRTVEAADQLNLIPEELTKTKALVTIFAPDLLENSIKVACDLRENKINTELYPNENAKLDKQLKYADKKGIPYVLIIGPEEVKESKVVLKNLKTKEQTKTTIENVISLVK